MIRKLTVMTAVILCLSKISFAEISMVKLVNIVARAESSNNPKAIGDSGRSRGLCQLKQATWARYTSKPFSKAFLGPLNRDIAELHLMWIAGKYGKNATPAKIILTYNTGKFYKSLPKWAKKHPNKVYRALMRREK